LDAAKASSTPLPATQDIPQSGNDLTQLGQEQYNLELGIAASLGYAVFELSAGVKHDVLIFQAARYKDINVAGETYRYGVVVEATIIATTANLKVGATLPVIAANVQLTDDQASSEIAVRGFAPAQPITLPPWGSFDVDGYSAFQASVTQLQKDVLFNNEQIRPVLLATTNTPTLADPPKPGPRPLHWLHEHL
jgi:hypothetical protein